MGSSPVSEPRSDINRPMKSVLMSIGSYRKAYLYYESAIHVTSAQGRIRLNYFCRIGVKNSGHRRMRVALSHPFGSVKHGHEPRRPRFL